MKTNIFRIITQLTIVVALCISCTKYEPIDIEKQFHTIDETKNNYSLDKDWWKKYNDNELNRLVDISLNNNTDYIKAALNINKALYNLGLATDDLIPTLSGALDASTKKQRKSSTIHTFSGELALNYELDIWGKLRDTRNAKELEYKATIMDMESARLTLINSIVDLYFDLTYLNNSIAITKNTIDNYTEIYSIYNEKYKSGKIEYSEVLTIHQDLKSAENDLLNLKTQKKELEHNLNNLLNLKSDEHLDINYTDILKAKSVDINVDIPLSVLSARPDVKASEMRLEESFKSFKAQQKTWYPSITIGSTFGSSSDKAKSTFDLPYIAGTISIDLPFLDWNRVKNNVKISEIEYETAKLTFKNTLVQALNEADYYYFAYKNAKEKYENLYVNYQSNVQNKAYYQERYDNGKVEFTDLVSASNDENSSELKLIEQKYQVIKYANLVFKAIGGYL
jgi:NodT family efflux transporter outer membrane factor (OMF) lipoprotein